VQNYDEAGDKQNKLQNLFPYPSEKAITDDVLKLMRLANLPPPKSVCPKTIARDQLLCEKRQESYKTRV
jgi:hypothetical protein